ncbi:MAG: caspase family protein [Rhodomicrobium sp.]
MTAYACVIGNPSTGNDLRPGIRSDVEKVVDCLGARAVVITNYGRNLGLVKADMVSAVEALVEQTANQRAMAIFYYCGHAVESRDPKDIYLWGQDVIRADHDQAAKSLSLLGCVEMLRGVQGLKIVILDACRVAADGEEMGLWEAFEDVHRDLLRSILDLYIITATGSGKRAWQGHFTNNLISLIEAIGHDNGQLHLPLEGWLRNAFGKITKKHPFMPKPKLYCDAITREWTISELLKGGKMTKEQLDEAQEELKTRREQVWNTPNGIQFIMHSIHHKRWETLQRTEFKVIDQEGNKSIDIISESEGDAIRNFLIEVGSKIFEEAKKSDEPREESGYSICDKVPSRYGPMIYWRWRIEPRDSFVFLAGGVGPEKKQDDWSNHSSTQLRQDTPNGLMVALTAYSDAYKAYHSG